MSSTIEDHASDSVYEALDRIPALEAEIERLRAAVEKLVTH
jgi:uncharacterized small protein (DUF1192 family)